MKNDKRELSISQRNALLQILKERFEKNKARHSDIPWHDVQDRLESNPDRLWSLYQMEMTGGEPDIIGKDVRTGEYIFVDCSAESPKGRRSICYDKAERIKKRA